MVIKLAQKPLNEIVGKEGGVARDGDNVTSAGTVGLDPLKSRMDTGERSGKTCHSVGDNRQAKARKARGLAISIDDNIGNLRPQASDDRGKDRSACQRQQAFVAAPHPA